jgi:hypothetical protein
LLFRDLHKPAIVVRHPVLQAVMLLTFILELAGGHMQEGRGDAFFSWMYG